MKYTNFILTIIALLLLALVFEKNPLSLISTARAASPMLPDRGGATKVIIVGIGDDGKGIEAANDLNSNKYLLVKQK